MTDDSPQKAVAPVRNRAVEIINEIAPTEEDEDQHTLEDDLQAVKNLLMRGTGDRNLAIWAAGRIFNPDISRIAADSMTEVLGRGA
jgi:hypothetical protein